MKLSAVMWGKRIEIFGAWALAFSLPIMESPKNIAAALMIMGAIVWRLATSSRRWRRPDLLEVILLANWSATVLSLVVNWPVANGLKALKDTTCFLFLFWLMYRGDLSSRQLRMFFWILVAGALVGLGWGTAELLAGKRPYLEFHSAGVVTQSAIYLGTLSVAMVGVVLDKSFANFERLTTAVCLVICFGGLVAMGSRGALLGVIVAFSLLAAFMLTREAYRGMLLRMMLAAGIVVLVLALFAGRSMITERVSHLKDGFSALMLKEEDLPIPDQMRFDHWRLGWTQALQSHNPFLGIGPRNFPNVKIDQLELDPPLRTYPNVWQRPAHAHNFLLTKWCEEGLWGLITLLALLGYVTLVLVLDRPLGEEGIHWEWVAGIGALVVPVIAASFNSPFINEFAWLAMMLMGVAIHALHDKAKK